MSVRSTMSDLIAKVRLLTADASTGGGNGTYFSDQQIQDQMDRCRFDVQYGDLELRYTLQPSAYLYTDYYAPNKWGDWESDAVLIDGHFTTLTPLTSDYIVGHWTFTNQIPPVFVKGKTFDVYRAAADLIEMRLMSVATTTFDFTADGRSFSLGQVVKTLTAMRDSYRSQERAISIGVRRDDFGIDPESDDRRALAGPVSAGVPFITGD